MEIGLEGFICRCSSNLYEKLLVLTQLAKWEALKIRDIRQHELVDIELMKAFLSVSTEFEP